MPLAAGWRSLNAPVNPNHRYRPSRASALILSPDQLGAALVAAAVEVAGVRPVFPCADEASKAALRRQRPAIVVVSADHPCLHDHGFVGSAKMLATRVIVFGRTYELEGIDAVVERFGFEVLSLPRDAAVIGRRLTEASESSRRRPESTAP